MRSTRGSNPTLVGRVASVQQLHSGVDDKNPGGKRKAVKSATVCEQMSSTRGSNPTLEGRVASIRQRHTGVDGRKTEGVESGNRM
ncbi:hypothetical protein KIN20_036617 [Parelaphostrongylus tenuis]|uniref:Uncharacterized protein n=1 Tax=Parelaphostrongylus tenuis TaxID=148309 RepID=A0AAD5WKK7_PARTN|nr:hypothetical protein KIN20_036617 [Parelaphostrongylus tenuis]